MLSLGLRRALTTLALLGLAACGSRSGLYGPETEGAGGGDGGTPTTSGGGATTSSTTTTSSSSTGGEGGGGAPPVACGTLDYVTPFASIAGGTTADQRAPKLTYSSDDGERVTLVSAWQYAEGASAPKELRRTNLEPWGDFPAGVSLGNTNVMDYEGGKTFAVAPSPFDRYAMIFADFEEPPAGGLRFWAGYDPGNPNAPDDTLLVDAQSDTALFLSHAITRWAYAGSRQVGGTHQMTMGLLAEDFAESWFTLGCASGPALADAVPVGDSFLVAITSGVQPFGCDFDLPGPPNRIQAASVHESAAIDAFVEIGSAAATDLRLAPRDQGAWIVWSQPAGEDLPPSLAVGRLNVAAQLEAFTLLPANYQPGSVAIASGEGYFFVAWIESEPEGASPRVQAFDEDLNPAGKITVQATGLAKGSLGFLGSPFGPHAVLAWSEELGGDQDDQIRMTLVGCAGDF